MRADVEAWMKANNDEGKIYGEPRLSSDPDRAKPPPPAKKHVWSDDRPTEGAVAFVPLRCLVPETQRANRLDTAMEITRDAVWGLRRALNQACVASAAAWQPQASSRGSQC
jgi:hypothetical protein